MARSNDGARFESGLLRQVAGSQDRERVGKGSRVSAEERGELFCLAPQCVGGHYVLGGEPLVYGVAVFEFLYAMRIGEACFDAGDMYNDLLPPIDRTSDGNKAMAGQDGRATQVDTGTLQVRDQLRGFLSTTTGRYILAGKQVEAAAEDYAKTDDDQKDAYNRIMDDWDKAGIDDVHVHGDPNDMAKPTDRGNSHPGANDDTDYVTD